MKTILRTLTIHINAICQFKDTKKQNKCRFNSRNLLNQKFESSAFAFDFNPSEA